MPLSTREWAREDIEGEGELDRLKGFITGIRQRFFKNGQSAWEVPEVKAGDEPFRGGFNETGNDLRSRQVVKEISYKYPGTNEYCTATKTNYLHHHPFMI